MNRRTDVTEGHKNQIREMKKEGKRSKDIVAFMKEQYGIEINSSYICGVVKPKRERKDQPAGTRPYKKRAAIEDQLKSVDVLVDGIIGLIVKLKAAYADKLLMIRKELIKACAEMRKEEE